MMIRGRSETLVSAALLLLAMARADLVAAQATAPPATLKVTGDVRTPLSQ